MVWVLFSINTRLVRIELLPMRVELPHSKTRRVFSFKVVVSETFHDYLCSGKFKVITNNNPLTYVLTTAKLNATR